jgi:hypothetical protein
MEKRLASHVGKPVNELVSAAGPPSAVTQNGEEAVWSWRTYTGQSVVAGSGWANVSSGVCDQWFDVDGSGVVRGWHWRGDCY